MLWLRYYKVTRKAKKPFKPLFFYGKKRNYQIRKDQGLILVNFAK